MKYRSLKELEERASCIRFNRNGSFRYWTPYDEECLMARIRDEDECRAYYDNEV